MSDQVQHTASRGKFNTIEDTLERIVSKAGQLKHYKELQMDVIDPETGDDMGLGKRIEEIQNEQKGLAKSLDSLDDRGTVRPRLMLSYLSQLAECAPSMSAEAQAILAQAMVLSVAPFIAKGNPEQDKVIAKWEKDFPSLPVGILLGNRQKA